MRNRTLTGRQTYLDMDPVAVAHHESGHGIAAHVLGVEVDRLTIRSDGVYAGRCFRAECDSDKAITIALAGMVAEATYIGSGVQMQSLLGSFEDWQRLIRLYQDQYGRAGREPWKLPVAMDHIRRTEALVRRYWGAIHTIAELLLECRECSGAAVELAVDECGRLLGDGNDNGITGTVDWQAREGQGIGAAVLPRVRPASGGQKQTT